MSKTEPPTRFHREFDHTGDLGIEAEAGSLTAVFEEAALGMFELLTDLADVSDHEEYRVSVTGEGKETLLLNWLSELNFLHLTERALFSRFSIEEVQNTHLEAKAYGEHFDPDRHKIYTEIKAVTYHDMVIEERDEGWYARIIFDI